MCCTYAKFILREINITLFPSLADAGYLTTVTVQHAIFNDRCNSVSLECPYNIQQSPERRPQLPPQLPPPQYIGKCEIQWRNVKFSVLNH